MKILMLIPLLLVGCASTPKPLLLTDTGDSLAKKTVNVDPTSLKKCAPTLSSEMPEQVTKSTVLEIKAQDTKQYAECAKRQNHLVDVIMKTFDIKPDESK